MGIAETHQLLKTKLCKILILSQKFFYGQNKFEHIFVPTCGKKNPFTIHSQKLFGYL